jgi:transposase
LAILTQSPPGSQEEIMSELFWLSDAAWAVIAPHLPYNRPGARRVDDRRVISGVLHVLKSGCRWRDCPSAYGPATTIYNRFNRWSAQGIWLRLFERLVAEGGVPEELTLDATHIKAHRSASGGKRGKWRKRSVTRAAGARARSMRFLTLSAGRSRLR